MDRRSPSSRPPRGRSPRLRHAARARLALGLLLALPWLPAWAAGPAQDASFIAIDAAQRTALGVRVAELRPAASAALSLPARVVVPAQAQAVVAAPAPGVLTRVDAASGDAVRRGQLLGEMQSTEVAQLQRDADDARIQFDLAREQHRRDAALLAEGIIPASRAQAAAARESQAASLLRERRLALRLRGAGSGLDGRVRLLAPIDGVVAQTQALPGQRVEGGAPLFHLIAANALALEIDATAEQAAALRAGAEVHVAGSSARGALLALTPALTPGQHVVLRARLSEPAGLHAGALVQARVQLPARAGMFSVPPSALTRVAERDSMLIEQPQGFRVVPVRVVARLPDAVIVDGPLRAGQQVVISGVVALKAGAGAKP